MDKRVEKGGCGRGGEMSGPQKGGSGRLSFFAVIDLNLLRV